MTDPLKKDAFDEFHDAEIDENKEKAKKASEFARLLEDSFKKPRKRLSVGEKIRGEILVIGKEDVFVSTGAAGVSTDGIVSRRDLLDAEGKLNYKVGDVLDLYVTQVRGSELYLSPKAMAVARAQPSERGRKERSLPQSTFAQDRREGDIVTGKVKKLEPFGAFVEVAPGVEGLLHISELSWSRVSSPAEVVEVGQEIQVKILKTEMKDGRLKISLSLKQTGAEPWALVPQNFPVGTIVTGKVERREPYGIFVQISEGITGLLPKSNAVTRPEFAFDKLKVGDVVTVQIGELKLQERRISLQVPKDMNEDDWKGYSSQTPSGSFGTLGDQMQKALNSKKQKS